MSKITFTTLFAIILSVAAVFADTITLTPNVDTYVNSDAPTTSYGTAQSLVAGYWNGGTLYAYMHFNVSGVDPATVTSATLTLHDAGTLLNPSMCVYRLGDTFSNSTTWNTRPNFYSTQYDCHTVTPASISFNITTLVVGWADGSFFNAGLMLRKNPDGAPNGTVAAGSAEHSVPSLRPELTIVYTCTPPTTPTITASDNRCDYVQLTWTNVANETGYEIQRNSVTIQTTGANVTSWQDVPSPGCYNYRVRALGSSCGNSNWSTVDQGCLYSAPATPSNFTATDGNGQVTLNWSDVSGEAGYEIRRDNQYLIFVNPNVTSYVDHPTPGCYTYQVRAFTSLCNGQWSISDDGCSEALEIQDGNFILNTRTYSLTWTPWSSPDLQGYELRFYYGDTTSSKIPTGTNWLLPDDTTPWISYYSHMTHSFAYTIELSPQFWSHFEVAANYEIQILPVDIQGDPLSGTPIITRRITYGRIESSGDGGDPILLVHGITANAETWADMSNRFVEDGTYKPYTLEYPNTGSIPVSAGLLKEAIEEVKSRENTSTVPVVTHSMGGLITRAYVYGMARNLNNEVLPYQTGDVQQIVTIATPHRGGIAERSGIGTFLTGDPAWQQLSGIRSFIIDLNSHPELDIPSMSVVGYDDNGCTWWRCNGHSSCWLGWLHEVFMEPNDFAVNVTSAEYQYALNLYIYYLHYTHCDIVRPTDVNDARFTLVRDFLIGSPQYDVFQRPFFGASAVSS
jgi:hypothetical protein